MSRTGIAHVIQIISSYSVYSLRQFKYAQVLSRCNLLNLVLIKELFFDKSTPCSRERESRTSSLSNSYVMYILI